jgi:hypothetical protein
MQASPETVHPSVLLRSLEAVLGGGSVVQEEGSEALS